jgi:hypothetical protein
MTAIQDREKLKKLYPGDKWSKKVDKMSDAQVAAVLIRMKQKQN